MNLRQGGPTGAAADASFGIDQQARVDQANGGFMAVGELARQMIARAGARSGLEHGNRNAQFRGRNLDVQLSTFSARGTKLMLIHGMSDPLFSAYDTARYYERVVRDNGGLDKTLPWVRYFEIPGMNHWGGQGQIISRREPPGVGNILSFRIIVERVPRTTRPISSAARIRPSNKVGHRPAIWSPAADVISADSKRLSRAYRFCR